MRSLRAALVLMSLGGGLGYGLCQEIAIGAWRTHASFREIRSIAIGENKVFAAAQNGLMIYHFADQSISTVTRLNGLSSGQLNALAFDNGNQQLLIGHQDGQMDIIRNQQITTYKGLKTSAIEGSKAIHDIAVHGTHAYLAGDYGLLVFDLNQGEAKETYRDIGMDGERVGVIQCAFLGDSIYLATDHGVLAGALMDNLLDYRNWTHYDTPPLDQKIAGLTSFNNTIFAAVYGSGLYMHEATGFTQVVFPGGTDISRISSSQDYLFISAPSHVWTMNATGQFIEIADPLIKTPGAVMEDDAGTLWIGDNGNGLLSNHSGSFEVLLPNGPPFDVATNLVYTGTDLYALAGGWNSVFEPLDQEATIGDFQNGRWSTIVISGHDATEIVKQGERLFVSSFGDGIILTNPSQQYDETNSPLEDTPPGSAAVLITSMARQDGSVWIANYGATAPLHELAADGSWKSFTFQVPAASYPAGLMVDSRGFVWMALDGPSASGLIVFDPASGREAYLDDGTDTGGLPDRHVHALAEDRDGRIWAGTSHGIVYFAGGADPFAGAINAVRPVLNNQYLLQSEEITTVAVDGGNRIWVGTHSGIWLFGSAGSELVHHFTAANSPLPSDEIQDVALNGVTGEVFVATDEGIVSYRADATTATADFAFVKVFPNPVTPDFNGLVGITGLPEDAMIRITDPRGKLVWNGQATGGTAAWNIRDLSGKRVQTGVYLVFMAARDGRRQSMVGKVTVVTE